MNDAFKSTDGDQEYKDVIVQHQDSPYNWSKG